MIPLLLASLLCPTTIVYNPTKVWNTYDQKSLESAAVRCGAIYKDAPCLTKFYKKSTDQYMAVCGSEL